jgi:hypothetical protein
MATEPLLEISSRQTPEIRLFIPPLDETKSNRGGDMIDDTVSSPPSPPTVPTFSPPQDEPIQVPSSSRRKFMLFGVGLAILMIVSFLIGYKAPLPTTWLTRPLLSQDINPESESDPGLILAQRFKQDLDPRESTEISIFFDENKNERFDTGDYYLNNASLMIRKPGTENSFASVTTDSNGKVILFGTPPGKYEVFLSYSPTNAYSSFFKFNHLSFPESLVPGKDISERVIVNNWIPIEITKTKNEFPLQQYQPKNIVVGRTSNVVIYFDLDIQRQVAWVSSDEPESQSQVFKLVGKDTAFIDKSGDVVLFNWDKGYTETALANPGIQKLNGFEYAILSPSGKTVAFTRNTSAGSELAFGSSNSSCSSNNLTWQGKPFFLQTSSNPWHYFPLHFYNENKFAFIGKTADISQPRVFVVECRENGFDVTTTPIEQQPNGYMVNVSWLNEDNLFIEGTFQKASSTPQTSATPSAALQQAHTGTGVYNLKDKQLGSLGNFGTWIVNPEHKWLASYSLPTVNFLSVEDVLHSQSNVIDSGKKAQSEIKQTWSGNTFYFLSNEKCPTAQYSEANCAKIEGVEMKDGKSVTVSQWTLENQTFDEILGVIRL